MRKQVEIESQLSEIESKIKEHTNEKCFDLDVFEETHQKIVKLNNKAAMLKWVLGLTDEFNVVDDNKSDLPF